MNDFFDLLLSGKFSRELLLPALAKVYDIPVEDINLQFSDNFDMSCSVRRLFCYVLEFNGVPFPVLLTLSYSDIESDYNGTTIACKLSHALGCSGVARLRMTKNGLPRNVPLSQRAADIWSRTVWGHDCLARLHISHRS